MRRLHIKFPNQIRISDWDFGSSARAMNQSGGKNTLSNPECIALTQAALEKVSKTTTERKIMSTKTLLKKVAVVAVAALTLGSFTAISASADPATSVTSSLNGNLTVAAGTVSNTTITVGGADGSTASIGFTIAGGATVAWATSSATNVTLTGTSPAAIGVTKTINPATNGSFAVAITLGGTTGGTVTVTGLTAGSLVYTIGTAPSAGVDNPFVVKAQNGVTAGTGYTLGTAATSIAVTKSVASSTDYVAIEAVADTVVKSGSGNYRYVEVTGSTIQAVSDTTNWVLNGSVNAATQAAVPQDGMLVGDQVWVNTNTPGQTITVKFIDRKQDATTGFISTSVLQTITITTAAYAGLNAALSTAQICSNGVNTPLGVAPVAVATTYPKTGCSFAGTTDDSVLASAALTAVGGTISGIGTAKAVIKVTLNAMAADGTATPLLGTLPAIGASISGPGTLSIGTSANADPSTGRFLTASAAPNREFYINVFSDGTSGSSTVSIWVGGSVWKTKTVNFYGAAKTLVASSGLKVLAAGTTYAVPSTACVALGTCGSTVALTPVVQVLATDANGIAVPGLSYTAVADGTVLLNGASSSNSGNAVADSIGATWFGVITSPLAASGATGTVSYKTTLADATVLTSNSVSFAIGGAISTVSMALGSSSNTEVGAKNAVAFTAKDASGNAAYDQDVDAKLTSNVALVSGDSAATSGLPYGTANLMIVGGQGSDTFFNPQTAQEVTISGTVAGKAVTLTYSTANSATNAAVDAANEATDAANAATDAANAAAEAADAATAAAQDAQAAVAELATRVASLIAAIKAQITSLTNLIIKIKNKVRA